MASKAKRTTRKAPKATTEGSDTTNSSGQSVKLGLAVKKIEFIERLLGRSITAFGGAPGADTIHGALAEAQSKVAAAITDVHNLPAGFRFGGGGSGGIAIGATVSVKEKHGPKYGNALGGNLTVREIGNGMILVETPGQKMAWVPRGHLARVEADVAA